MAKLRVVGSGAPFATPDDVEALAEAKLASSGLTLEDGQKLGMSWLTAEETKTLNVEHPHLPTLKIPYFNPRTGEPLSPRPKWPALYRLRMLRDPVPLPTDYRKYTQESGSGLSAFFPRIIDWSLVLDDYRVPIIITEGELKAAKACKEDFPTIGLGGVWSWKAMAQGHSFLPELECVTWPRREVFIIFDSDARENEQICKALMALAEELQDRGALPRTALLPEQPGVEKTGLDDLLVGSGADTLRDVLKGADHLLMARPLWQMNEEFVYVRDTGTVVRRATGGLYKPESIRTHADTKKYYESKLLPNGVLARQKTRAGDVWLDWAFRSEAERIVYSPGKDALTIIEDDDGAKAYNVWSGWACKPEKGDVKAFVKLFDYLMQGAEPEAKQWFLRWIAFPIQNPGKKLFSAAVLHSREQGVGKTLLGLTLELVYGKNLTTITQDALTNSFNEWAAGRQLALIDDVSGGSDKRHDHDKIKTLVTQKKIWVNRKNIAQYEILDCMNFLFSSNHQDVLFLEQTDRRFFIHEVKGPPLPAEDYKMYDAWMKMPEAGPALFDYLLHVDLGDFNPNAPPPITAAKTNMVRLSRTDIDDWVELMLETPEEFLKVGQAPIKADLLTLAELRACYTSYAGKEPDISQIGFSRKLAQHGVAAANNGDVIYVPHRPLARYYSVRRCEHWAKQSLDAIKRHLGAIAADERMRGV